ncbi:MAG TPA: CoA-acylating methylmalonate-semialdehyde dehydrogenase [Symbiobacteriaceae bacterium]|nr:CoA-acylating methylmalonate-semialdehyde dehydrogenase [Symbiobacteriaceae bacterium]
MSSHVKEVPLLIGGQWVTESEVPQGTILNPADGRPLAQVPLCGPAQVDRAVAAAKAAYPTWSQVPPVERARYLFRYRALLDQHFEAIARLIATEHGKTVADARGSLRRGLEVVEFACGIPTLLMGQALENIARDIDGSLIRQPLGVVAGITPFNFPAMIPLWMIPLAIASGNTFVLKPSPRVPLTAVRLLELLQEAGLPDGVVNLVHGDKPAVDAILAHPDIKAVSFVGSSPVARYVYETGAAHGKRVQALGGAKNFLTVMPDADLEKTVHGVIESAFGSGGQRCLAASVVLAVGSVGDKLVDRLVTVAREYAVGDGLAEATRMGPLNSPAGRDRVVEYIDRGLRAGAKLVLDGRDPAIMGRAGGCYVAPTIFDYVPPESDLARDEIFGPLLSVIRVKDLEEAIAVVNASRYGNTSSIFTRDGLAARTYVSRVDAGMMGVNVGVAGPMAFFSFGGHKESFFGDLRVHGMDGVRFYTSVKSVTTRWF